MGKEVFDMSFLVKIEIIIVIGLFCGCIFCKLLAKFEGKYELPEDKRLTQKKTRQYLFDKYKAEVKQNHPEIDFNSIEDTVDFCLKLQSMDDDALVMAYNKVKEQDSE